MNQLPELLHHPIQLLYQKAFVSSALQIRKKKIKNLKKNNWLIIEADARTKRKHFSSNTSDELKNELTALFNKKKTHIIQIHYLSTNSLLSLFFTNSIIHTVDARVTTHKFFSKME